MKIIRILILSIVALLSLAAGMAKLMQAPAEMEFLRGAGLSDTLILLFGALQVLAGILVAIPASRTIGAILAAVAFAASAALILISGNMVFALVSAIPLALAVYIALKSGSPASSPPEI